VRSLLAILRCRLLENDMEMSEYHAWIVLTRLLWLLLAFVAGLLYCLDRVGRHRWDWWPGLP